eukprot:GHVU01140196.1.p1 GENE.GHVU01140196.1~~GHVU01140196.1.p1  ORF type:complete len:109 (+),score=7.00 GHVU01140196.1:300-626(+)
MKVGELSSVAVANQPAIAVGGQGARRASSCLLGGGGRTRIVFVLFRLTAAGVIETFMRRLTRLYVSMGFDWTEKGGEVASIQPAANLVGSKESRQCSPCHMYMMMSPR